MILGIFFILVCILILVKYVILIHKTNNKVISLFGMIKAIDIRELVIKCEHFADKFLESKKKERDKELTYSMGGGTLGNNQQPQEKNIKASEEDQSYLQINPNNQTDMQNDNKMDISNILDENVAQNKKITEISIAKNIKSVSSSQIENDDPSKKNAKIYLAPPNKSANNKEAAKKNPPELKSALVKPLHNETEDLLKNKNEEKNDEKDGVSRDEIRQKRLMNTVDNTTRIILLQYSVFVFLFWTYFILDYVFITIFLSQVRTCYSHLELIAERPSIVKYRIVFTYEEIANSQKQIQHSDIFDNNSPMIDVTENYREQMYANENKIFNSLKSDYPSYFNEYQNQFQILNYGDLCVNFIESSDQQRFSGLIK